MSKEANPKVFVAIIYDLLDPSGLPGVAAFSSEEKRKAFYDAARKRVTSAGNEEDFQMFSEAVLLDNDSYLDYLECPPVDDAPSTEGPWLLTDAETMRHVRRVGPHSYELIEYDPSKEGDTEYWVYADIVNLTEYTYSEFHAALEYLDCLGYASLADVKEKCGKSAVGRVVAECLFQYFIDHTDMYYFSGTKEEAIAYVGQFMRGEAE